MRTGVSEGHDVRMAGLKRNLNTDTKQILTEPTVSSVRLTVTSLSPISTLETFKN